MDGTAQAADTPDPFHPRAKRPHSIHYNTTGNSTQLLDPITLLGALSWDRDASLSDHPNQMDY